MTWFRKFATASMPVHQSHLNSLASQNGCGKRFHLEMEAELFGGGPPERAHWSRVLGTACHKVIERALLRGWPEMVRVFEPGSALRPMGAPPNWAPRALRERFDEIVREELEHAREQQPIEWRDEDPETQIRAGVDMVIGAVRTVVERARKIVAVEAPFRAVLDGYHTEGTIDLLYEPHDLAPGTLVLADWKFGERKLPQIVVDHGYQLSMYGHAVAEGVLFPDTERETHLGIYPAEMYLVHCRDFVPYVRKPRTPGKKIGDLRGPGWVKTKRDAEDLARFRVSLRELVGTVRMGRRLEQIGEQCARCPFRGPCLGDGHRLPVDEKRQLERALDGLDLSDVLPDVA